MAAKFWMRGPTGSLSTVGWPTAYIHPNFETGKVQKRVRGRRSRFKRAFDVTAALAGIVLLSPMLIMVSCLLLVFQGRPILIRHRRIGRHATVFGCFKFRTMVKEADLVLLEYIKENSAAQSEWAATRKLKLDPRITPLGKILRRSSIDELPQLFNIIKGDMSVVGPRPIVQDELKYYGAKIGDYYRVRPGLTGLWQISGRSDLSYNKRVALDCEYGQTRSFLGDMKIILKTVPTVLSADGSY